MKAIAAPIELKALAFDDVHFTSNYDGGEEQKTPQAGDLDVSVQVFQHSEDKLWMVVLTVSLPSDAECAYTFEIAARGIFEVHHDECKCDADEHRFAYVNGASILFGSIRDMVMTLSGKGPWPSLTLPAISFFEAFKVECEAIDEAETEPTKSLPSREAEAKPAKKTPTRKAAKPKATTPQKKSSAKSKSK